MLLLGESIMKITWNMGFIIIILIDDKNQAHVQMYYLLWGIF